MSKRKIPSNLFSQPININIKWMNSFIEWLRVNETTDIKTLKQSKQILNDLFSLSLNNSKKPFNEFITDDLRTYVDLLVTNNYAPQTVANQLSCISKFITYIVSQYRELFPLRFLEDINTLRKPYQTGLAGQPLNLVQLSVIREYRKQDPKSEFCFELFFQLDIGKKDVTICSPENLNCDRWVFEKDGREISINSGLKELIRNTENYNDFHISYEMVNNYLKKITNYLRDKNVYNGDNLTLYDIKKTRERFFMHCPNCNLVFECTSENWVLSKTEFESTYHIVCNKCLGRPQNEF